MFAINMAPKTNLVAACRFGAHHKARVGGALGALFAIRPVQSYPPSITSRKKPDLLPREPVEGTFSS